MAPHTGHRAGRSLPLPPCRDPADGPGRIPLPTRPEPRNDEDIMRPIRILAFASAVVVTVHGTSAAAQSAAERLTWHGYLTQGYGVSSPVPILGLNRDPSGDYRAAALQLRYAMSPADNFVVQAATRSMGTSPYSSSSSGSVSVDWAFYQHQFEHASVQVGRIP